MARFLLGLPASGRTLSGRSWREGRWRAFRWTAAVVAAALLSLGRGRTGFATAGGGAVRKVVGRFDTIGSSGGTASSRGHGETEGQEAADPLPTMERLRFDTSDARLASLGGRRQQQSKILDKLKSKKYVSGVSGSEGATLWVTRSKTPEERTRTRAIVLTKEFFIAVPDKDPSKPHPFSAASIDIIWTGKVFVGRFQVLGNVFRDGEPGINDYILTDARGNHLEWYVKASAFASLTNRPPEELHTLWEQVGSSGLDFLGVQELGGNSKPVTFAATPTIFINSSTSGARILPQRRAMDVNTGLDETSRAQLHGTQDISMLSDAIMVGSMVLKGEWQVLIAGFLVLLLFLLGVCFIMHLRAHRQAQMHYQAILQALMSLQPEPRDSSLPSVPGDGAVDPIGDAQASLLCIDSKLLELSREVQSFRQQATSGPNFGELLEKSATELKQAMENADAVSQEAVRVASLTGTRTDEVFEVVAQIPPMSKAVQALGLEVSKRFAVQETTADSLLMQSRDLSDSILKQGRDSLQSEQAEHKATQDKLATLQEKLATLLAAADELKSSMKQLSLDVHVKYTRVEQKLESVHGDLKQHAGFSSSTLRGLNVLVPGQKHTQDGIRDATDYLVKAQQSGSTMMESVGNIEDRVCRLESIVMGLQDQNGESNDLLQQIREAQNILQEGVSSILERTPKLPRRSPPQDNSNAAASTTTGPTPMPAATPQPADAQPIRLSDHLQPQGPQQNLWPREGSSQIFIRELVPQLNNVGTADLLRALLQRGNF
ncbi:hypothetical protein AK812_SmicGene27320 [Symbiodinium microadriaticum]|uniref:Uncharacterized protein n=1 Tax=Symbiodinium microadriaticum TaxID=2951 RepID=A0A1Q9D786_SYMMI|nr:hypothetical protein AK812_SmicGene27320 [Symbiodinium microadriaticum]